MLADVLDALALVGLGRVVRADAGGCFADQLLVDALDGLQVTVKGIDKQLVGEAAARIRSYYPAEPYKGKGIKYVGERIRRKQGKKVA